MSLLRDILKTHGCFSFLFANAGYAAYRYMVAAGMLKGGTLTNNIYQLYRPLHQLGAEYFIHAVEVMQRGPYLAVKYGGQARSATMAEKRRAKGNIVIMSSCTAFAGTSADIAYTATILLDSVSSY